MDWLDEAIQQVIEVSAPGFDNKADAVAYYQKTYGTAKKGSALPWKQNILHGLLASRGVREADKGKKEYQRQYKNLSKRFDSGAKQGKQPRLTTPEPKNAKEYQKLALSIGVRKAPKNGYHVHYRGGILFSECERVDFEIDVTGELADELAAHPENLEDIVMRVYLEEQGQDEATIGTCDLDKGGKNEMTVTANPDDRKPPARQRKGHAYAKPFFKR